MNLDSLVCEFRGHAGSAARPACRCKKQAQLAISKVRYAYSCDASFNLAADVVALASVVHACVRALFCTLLRVIPSVFAL